MAYRVFWIEGPIAAGKTTLTGQLAEEFNMRPIYEPVDSNPLLALFYKDKERWAFSMQMYLMVKRLGMQRLAVNEARSGDKWDGAILDRGLPGDRVFCKMLMDAGLVHPLEWETYQSFYDEMAMEIPPPSLVIYLDVSPAVAYARMCERDRAIERVGVSLDYLKQLHAAYEDLIDEIESRKHLWSRGMEVLRVDWNEPNYSELIGVLRDENR